MRPSVFRIACTLLLAAPLGGLGAQSNIRRRDTTALVNRSANPVLAPFRFRSVGPASMGGRIDAG